MNRQLEKQQKELAQYRHILKVINSCYSVNHLEAIQNYVDLSLHRLQRFSDVQRDAWCDRIRSEFNKRYRLIQDRFPILVDEI